MTKLIAAVVQATPVPGDTPATIAKAVDKIAECAKLGAKLAVFPEAFIGGYPKGADFGVLVGRRSPEGRAEFAAYSSCAIAVPGPETAALGRAAKQAEIFVVMGVIERDGSTLYCTALHFGPDGALLSKHRKVMPTGSERLCWGFGDGSTLSVVDTPWGKMGSVICWENYMPLLRMTMYAKGIALYCAPTADDRDSWVATMRHVALEGRCFVLSSCQYLTRSDFTNDIKSKIPDEVGPVLMRGGSMIIDPLGQVLAGPDHSGEIILTAELDMSDIEKSRLDFDVIGHYARPDLFQLTVNERPMHVIRANAEGRNCDV